MKTNAMMCAVAMVALVAGGNAVAVDYTISTAVTATQIVGNDDTVTVTGTGSLDVGTSYHGISGGLRGNVSPLPDNVHVTVQSNGQLTATGIKYNGIGGRTIWLGDNAQITVAAGATVKNRGYDGSGVGYNGVPIYAGANAMIDIAGHVIAERYNGLPGYNNHAPAVYATAGSVVTIAAGGLAESKTDYGNTVHLMSGTLINHGTAYGSGPGARGARGSQNANTIINDGLIDSTSDGSGNRWGILFDDYGTNNVLNQYGTGEIRGPLVNDGLAGGATINFGFDGTQADPAAVTTIVGDIGSAAKAWHARVYAGNHSITGAAFFYSLQLDAGATLAITGTVNIATAGNLRGAGTLAGNLTLADDALLVFNEAATLTVNDGTVDLGNMSVESMLGLSNTTPNGTYTLMGGNAQFNTARMQNFGAAHAYDLGNGKSAYFQKGSLQLVVIPEPAIMAGLSVMLIVLAGLCRRSRGSI